MILKSKSTGETTTPDSCPAADFAIGTMTFSPVEGLYRVIWVKCDLLRVIYLIDAALYRLLREIYKPSYKRKTYRRVLL